MSLDYQKLKKKQEDDGSFWTSYSDLFMVLCVVFLLLYVVASLRSTTSSVQSLIENQKLKSEREDLKKQLQAYNALKDDYLEKEASQDEAKMYEELMDKLSLLQEEAKDEKRKLEAQAEENAAKARALNQYQQMVRNIVNTNLLSNKKIKVRNELIVKKNDTIKKMDETIDAQTKDITEKAQVIAQNQQQIAEQEQEIQEKQQVLEQKQSEVQELQSDLEEKTQVIAKNESQINTLNDDLSKKIAEAQKLAKTAKTSKAVLNRKIAMMKLENAKKIGELQKTTNTMKQSVAEMNQELASAATQLEDAKTRIQEQEALKQKLEEDMAQANENYKAQVAQMNQNFDSKIKAEREALEKQLASEKASASEKIKRLNEFKNKVAEEKEALNQQVASLQDQVGKAEFEANSLKNRLDKAKKDHEKYLSAINQLEKDKKDLKQDNQNLSGDLKRAQEIANAKKKLARKIAANLAKNGVKAGVNENTGDVTIHFGDEYFDTGKAHLKDKMKETLKKFVPTYSKSLLEDEKIAKEIASVEIIGFSSPTYRGRYVDPQSLKEQDRAAVSYNLDLSYNRAKSIFSYMFDKKKLEYTHQKDLLPLVKVTGRSFLAEEVKGRSIASGLSIKDYCAKYNCEKSQKVIIKFNLKD